MLAPASFLPGLEESAVEGGYAQLVPAHLDRLYLTGLGHLDDLADSDLRYARTARNKQH